MMQQPTKPKGLAKIWREIKRPFGKIWREIKRPFRQAKQGLRSLHYPLYRYVYRKAAKKNSIVLSEFEATESIIRNAQNMPEFSEIFETVVLNAPYNPKFSSAIESIVQNALNDHELFWKNPKNLDHDGIWSLWNKCFRFTERDKLKQLQSHLVAGMDDLSCEVVARFITRRLFFMEYAEPMWNLSARFLRFVFPLDFDEQERIRSLGESYKCPYRIPQLGIPQEHMATHFSLNQFPLEV